MNKRKILYLRLVVVVMCVNFSMWDILAQEMVTKQQEEYAKINSDSEEKEDVFQIENGTLVGYTGAGGDVVIPEGIKNIGDSAFYNCKNLTGITIPEGVTHIGFYAFSNCKNLTKVTISNSVIEIEGSAFRECSSLASIMIPNSVKHIGYAAFANCSSLASIIIPEDVIIYGKAFADTPWLEKERAKNPLVIVNNILIDGEEASGDVVIPDGVVCIEQAAFLGSDIKSITIPESVTEIVDEAFEGCSNLINISIPRGVRCIGARTFSSCRSLTSIMIPESVIGIGYAAFENCRNLKSVTIPERVTDIEEDAFANCHNDFALVVYAGSYAETYAKNNNIPYHCNEHKHSFQKQITTQPSCSIDGIWTYTCLECGEFYIESIPAVGHTYTKMTQEPTCTTKGTVTYTCSVCGYSYQKEIAVVAHKYAIETKAPTCIDEGVVTYICAMCGYSYQEEIAAVGHEYTGQVTIPSTCAQKGIKTFTCSKCGDSYTEELPLGSHTYTFQITRPSTCRQKGIKEYTCSVCGDSYTEEMSVVGHDYQKVTVKATTSKDGSIQKKCRFCGDVSEAVPIAYPRTITLSKSSVIYTGKVQKASVQVKDSAGKAVSSTNYSVSYSSNKNVGEATVTINFKGNYTGSVKKTFRILPKGTSLSKVSAKSKGFLAKWKKQAAQTNGYQIQYSANSKFKGKDVKAVSIKKNGTTSKSISKLKAKKKYYVRIRTYKAVKIKGKNVTLYSGWSKAKAIKTKK